MSTRRILTTSSSSTAANSPLLSSSSSVRSSKSGSSQTSNVSDYYRLLNARKLYSGASADSLASNSTLIGLSRKDSDGDVEEERSLLGFPGPEADSAIDAPPEFPTTSVAVLCLVRLAEPIALASIFPYVWPFVKWLCSAEGINDDSAAFRAGLLVAAFSLAEAMTGMFWGAVSDRIGRKPVLFVGCLGTILSLLIVGFASSFWTALAGRLLGGLLNGNVGVIQTMVTELAPHKDHLARAISLMPFTWTMGVIIGPFIGGYLADPVGRLIDPATTNPLGKLCISYPYLLPNIACAIILASALLFGVFMLPETNGRERRIKARQERLNEVAIENHSHYGTFSGESGSTIQKPLQVQPKRGQFLPTKVVMVIVGLGLYTFHSMCFDHLLPMFLQDQVSPSLGWLPAGGLGMSTHDVGSIIGMTGLLDLFLQLVVFPWLIAKLGTAGTFKLVTLIHPIPMLLLPFLVHFVPKDSIVSNVYSLGASALPNTQSSLSAWTAPSVPVEYLLHKSMAVSTFSDEIIPDPEIKSSVLMVLGLCVVITLRAISGIVAYPVLLMMITEAVREESKKRTSSHGPIHLPTSEEGGSLVETRAPNEKSFKSHLGAINGLAASVGAASRMLASPIAGYLFGIGTQMHMSALPWWTASGVALLGIAHMCNIH